MHSRRLHLILFAGVSSGVIFSLAFTGVAFLYLSVLPLLLLGLAFGANLVLPSALIACALSIVLVGTGETIFFAFFAALPTYTFIRNVLKYREKNTTQWLPVIQVIADITLYGALLFALAALMTAHYIQGGVPALLKHSVVIDTHNAPPETVEIMRRLVGDLSFFIFAFIGWSWIAILYVIATIANGFLVMRGMALRPSLALTPHGMPIMVLVTWVISGVLFCLSKNNDHFVAGVVFLLMQLPYLLYGLALMHQFFHHKSSKMVWLVLCYSGIIILVFPVFIVIAAGIYAHFIEILDNPRAMV